MPGMPQNAPGCRIEPPVSVPSAATAMPAATAAAEPPLEPPGVHRRSHGLRVRPCKGLSVNPRKPNSEVLVMPRMTAPAARSLATLGASALLTVGPVAVALFFPMVLHSWLLHEDLPPKRHHTTDVKFAR